MDRQSNLKEQAHDYVVYTQLSGLTSNASASGPRRSGSGSAQMGVMRMVSAIDVNWVAPLLPKLKDPVDIDRLNDPTKADIEESKYQD